METSPDTSAEFPPAARLELRRLHAESGGDLKTMQPKLGELLRQYPHLLAEAIMGELQRIGEEGKSEERLRGLRGS